MSSGCANVEPNLTQDQLEIIGTAVDALGHPDPVGAKERLGFLILVLNIRAPIAVRNPAQGRRQLKRLRQLALEASHLLGTTTLERSAREALRGECRVLSSLQLEQFSAACLAAERKLPRRANSLIAGNGTLALAEACADIYAEANPQWKHSLTSDLRECVEQVFTALNAANEDSSQGLHAIREHLKRQRAKKRTPPKKR
jgi:hypothetical protein